jgi:S-adenosylmethionine:tRNA ribosyltransferase-isomerase
MSELDVYDYILPRELIAQHPLPRRSDARLMVIDRSSALIEHRYIRDLPEILSDNDVLVLNDTKVIPARLVGYRQSTRGRWYGLFLESDDLGIWKLLCKTRGKMAPGESITLQDRDLNEAVVLRMLSKQEDGAWVAVPEIQDDPLAILDRVGRVPLPPYIRDGEMVAEDQSQYQTVFAKTPGSVAAPTAGLHFTPELFSQLGERGVQSEHVTLHVGAGTFRPIKADKIEAHVMHSEWCKVSKSAAKKLNQARSEGKRIIAIGTTALRTLETAAQSGTIEPFSGTTDIFIKPPHKFQGAQALLTNFHLPRSTLLVLVHAFGGEKLMRRAYEEAIEERYRFYSYGDAMLIV